MPAPKGVNLWLTDADYTHGHSQGSFHALNLAQHVGDDSKSVSANRALLEQEIGDRPIQWLNQVHGAEVVEVRSVQTPPDADAAFSSARGLGLGIMVADCVPIVLAAPAGEVVAVAHAGWRGLASGVIANLVKNMQQKPCWAYIGPAIGQLHYEVGEDV